MVYREVSVIEVREALRAWLAGKSERAVARQASVDRKTGKRYVTAAVAAGLLRDGGEGQLTDELIGQVVSVVRPVRPDGHGQGWAELEARREQIVKWVEGGVPVVKIGILLARQGVMVAERTLHRFAAERCGGSKVTTPVDDGPPGGELQIDIGDLGLIPAGDGRRRKLRALVFTACFSRYMFVYLTFSMTLEEVIAGCEEAWQFFSGVFRVVVPDNMSPVVRPGSVIPGISRGSRPGCTMCREISSRGKVSWTWRTRGRRLAAGRWRNPAPGRTPAIRGSAAGSPRPPWRRHRQSHAAHASRALERDVLRRVMWVELGPGGKAGVQQRGCRDGGGRAGHPVVGTTLSAGPCAGWSGSSAAGSVCARGYLSRGRHCSTR